MSESQSNTDAPQTRTSDPESDHRQGPFFPGRGHRHWWESDADWERWWKSTSEWDRWWRTDRVDAAVWATILAWAAAVIVADNTAFRDQVNWWSGWGVFWAGAGAITVVEAAIRLALPRYRAKWGWKAFWGVAYLTLGVAQLAGPIWIALPLTAAAVFMLVRAFNSQP